MQPTETNTTPAFICKDCHKPKTEEERITRNGQPTKQAWCIACRKAYDRKRNESRPRRPATKQRGDFWVPQFPY